MTTSKRVLRWICVLPGAVLGAFLVMFPVHWVVMLIHFFGDSGESFITVDGKNLLAAVPFETLEGFGDAFFVPFAFIFAGAYVAPRFKLVTGVVLTALLAIVIIIATTQIYADGSRIADGWFHLSFTCLFWIVGASCALLRAHEADNEAADARAATFQPESGKN